MHKQIGLLFVSLEPQGMTQFRPPRMGSTPGPEVANFIFHFVMQFMHYHPNIGCIQEIIIEVAEPNSNFSSD